MAKDGALPSDAARHSHDRNAPNWGPFCNLQETLPEEILQADAARSDNIVRAVVGGAVGQQDGPDYALRLAVLKRILRNSLRSELLLRLATLPALCSHQGEFTEVAERLCTETDVRVINMYYIGLYKVLLAWVGGSEAFGGAMQ